MKRSEAREKLFIVLFQREFHEEFMDIYKDLLLNEGLKGVQGEYALLSIEGIFENLEEIDTKIEKYLKNWSFDRLSVQARALLRLGVYEIVYNQDIPSVSAIDEAVTLAFKYSDEKEANFINGVLNNVYKEGQNE